MLSKTLTLAIPFAKALADSGIHLSVPMSSNIGVLVQHSMPDAGFNAQKPEVFETLVRECTVGVAGTMTDYEGYRESLINELIGPVKTHLRVAREVGTMVTTMAEAARKIASNSQDAGAGDNFMVVKDQLGPVFEHPLMMSSIGNRVGIIAKAPENPLLSGMRTRDELLGLITSTGDVKLNGMIQQMVEGFDYQWLENIYYAFFARSAGVPTPLNIQFLGGQCPGERASIYLVVSLMANQLLTSTPGDAMGSLASFRSGVADMRDFACFRAAQAIEEYNSQVSRGQLLTGYRRDGDNHLVYVNAVVYADWLENGGRPEIVLSASLSGTAAATVTEINNRASKLTDTWNSYCAVHASNAASRRAVFLRAVYLNCFVESLSQMAEFEKPYREQNIQHAEQAALTAQKWLEGQSVDRLDNFEQVSLELVAKIRFHYLPAYEILRDIDMIRRENSEVPVREAALVAATRYIARYLYTQMTVFRSK
jgi:hypothetical protein